MTNDPAVPPPQEIAPETAGPKPHTLKAIAIVHYIVVAAFLWAALVSLWILAWYTPNQIFVTLPERGASANAQWHLAMLLVPGPLYGMLVNLAVAFLVFRYAQAIRLGRNYNYCVTWAVAEWAFFPIGTILGLWGFTVLRRPDVQKEVFGEVEERRSAWPYVVTGLSAALAMVPAVRLTASAASGIGAFAVLGMQGIEDREAVISRLSDWLEHAPLFYAIGGGAFLFVLCRFWLMPSQGIRNRKRTT